jgi:hypothetical protein
MLPLEREATGQWVRLKPDMRLPVNPIASESAWGSRNFLPGTESSMIFSPA